MTCNGLIVHSCANGLYPLLGQVSFLLKLFFKKFLCFKDGSFHDSLILNAIDIYQTDKTSSLRTGIFWLLLSPSTSSMATSWQIQSSVFPTLHLVESPNLNCHRFQWDLNSFPMFAEETSSPLLFRRIKEEPSINYHAALRQVAQICPEKVDSYKLDCAEIHSQDNSFSQTACWEVWISTATVTFSVEKTFLPSHYLTPPHTHTHPRQLPAIC